MEKKYKHKKLGWIAVCFMLITACQKTNLVLETWVVWRCHDRVKEANHAYFCDYHIEGTKTLSIDPKDEHVYVQSIDSIVIHNIVPDSVDRDYIQWKRKLLP